MNVGVLTGGGDCPGLNAVIRAITYKGINHYNYNIYGIYEGWKGLLNGGRVAPLTIEDVHEILGRGGTILKTSRTNPFNIKDGLKKVRKNIEKYRFDAVIAVGGEDTLGVAAKLSQAGVHIVGVPKTIDNDVSGTDQTFGFDTAVQIATDAIDRVRSTAEAHNRVVLVEVMGRHAGWIAVKSGIAGGAHMILVPEYPVDIDKVVTSIVKRHARGEEFSVIVVAEGVKLLNEKGRGVAMAQDNKKDAFGHVRLGGIAYALSLAIEERTGFECRNVILGHIQRGGTPTAYDRVLSTRYGIRAIELVHKKQYGKMTALRGNKIVATPLVDAMKNVKTVDKEFYKIAEVFFG
ncbi:MAG: ATP-dependent 6-phosphofructokinase [candidate division Zixibacteria bacterium]|nr:ATP-dependent 6-phosphofructokinase [candidate division Zixibacteria bacterium]